MSTIEISRTEHGVIRVFAISRPMAEMARLITQQTKGKLASAFLGHTVSDRDVELFALSDLAGIGLPAYLSDGYDIDKMAVRSDHARLEALDGYVLLLFSSVSNDGDVSVAPTAELTLIGTYAEPKTEHTTAPIDSDAAKPYSGVIDTPQAPRRSRVGSTITAVTALLALLLLWWILQ